MSDATPVSAARDDEEPDRKAPEPESRPIRHDLQDDSNNLLLGLSGHEGGREVLWRGSGNVDNSGGGKGGRPDADKHSGSKCCGRKLLGHEAVDEGGVDGQGDEEADALQREATNNNGERFSRGKLVRERGRVWCHDEQRVSRENPNRCHGRNGKRLRAPHHDIYPRRGGDG